MNDEDVNIKDIDEHELSYIDNIDNIKIKGCPTQIYIYIVFKYVEYLRNLTIPCQTISRICTFLRDILPFTVITR